MGYIVGVSKYENIIFKTVDELEDYLEEEDCEEKEIGLFNMNFQKWTDEWLRKECRDRDKINSEKVILNRDMIERYVEHCNKILNNGYIEYYTESYFNANSIDDLQKLNEEIEIEVCDTREKFETLLKAEFESHTFIYWKILSI
ncbi:hypothetical protein [Clostridium beijerinckii]|uniref:Uncharacterized protein n=1 Tax=Clostridium beijerinckii TaxID=1520 RepID=A0AAW3W801_CLOBE|nr:hypothetical protein [Clostridium beijerinckii]MBC2457546.1 hypothetical protein [Clostridium beijerinckii]MBC2474629.1 hypothetical protein [Clostridium beijerinckii]NOV62414.1 hypothetical protein [Clostridium beijerinckii]NOV68089.1 hypothetical protein [Clostridium beijerinckii]NOW30466.1 hypothetical protein [Clostridium beijerinckii]